MQKNKLNWTDVEEIAIELEENHSNVDAKTILFTRLQSMILQLDCFEGDKNKCNERILEAIQQCWIEEQE